ncbi:hypothetical protein [Salinicola endophyticus]|uniref:hypothetical protein n=1 Tax=Salinicola endophyticus TaxID=1949083 RepID=UPI00165F51BC|nr:hypothetical protein [Salinicola endophyticus]
MQRIFYRFFLISYFRYFREAQFSWHEFTLPKSQKMGVIFNFHLPFFIKMMSFINLNKMRGASLLSIGLLSGAFFAYLAAT